jgi:ABC-type sugar transport system permease subunit
VSGAGTTDRIAARRNRWGWAFIAPYLTLTVCFFIYPLVKAVVLAFYTTNGPQSRVFVGLANFTWIFTDPAFYRSVSNTAIFAIFSVFLQLPLSLGLALLLNAKRDRLKGFFRLALFSPHLVGPVFVGIMFSLFFAPRYGLVNQSIAALTGGWGLDLNWLQIEHLVMPALVLTSLWMYVGFNMIYFLAALQNVPADLLDAAQVDGAGPWQRFRHVTMPAIKPVMVFVVVMSTIGSFQLFELPYTLLQQGWGPNESGLTIVGYLYRTAFADGDLGLGAAIGWVLTFLIFAISLAQIRISRVMRE